MPRRITLALDDGSSVVFLGSKGVVSRAAQRQVRSNMLAALREWLEMMQLQVARLTAALAPFIDVAAAPSVAQEYLAFRPGRDMSAALARRTVALLQRGGRNVVLVRGGL